MRADLWRPPWLANYELTPSIQRLEHASEGRGDRRRDGRRATRARRHRREDEARPVSRGVYPPPRWSTRGFEPPSALSFSRRTGRRTARLRDAERVVARGDHHVIVHVTVHVTIVYDDHLVPRHRLGVVRELERGGDGSAPRFGAHGHPRAFKIVTKLRRVVHAKEPRRLLEGFGPDTAHVPVPLPPDVETRRGCRVARRRRRRRAR